MAHSSRLQVPYFCSGFPPRSVVGCHLSAEMNPLFRPESFIMTVESSTAEFMRAEDTLLFAVLGSRPVEQMAYPDAGCREHRVLSHLLLPLRSVMGGRTDCLPSW